MQKFISTAISGNFIPKVCQLYMGQNKPELMMMNGGKPLRLEIHEFLEEFLHLSVILT